MLRKSPFLLETVVWFGFCFFPFHSITFFRITVSRIGIFLKVTYSNVSLCKWQKRGKQSRETFLGDGSPSGKVARMTLRCRSSKLEPPSLPSVQQGLAHLCPQNTKYLIQGAWYQHLVFFSASCLEPRFCFSSVCCQWNGLEQCPLSLRLILLMTWDPSFIDTVQHLLPWCPCWPVAYIFFLFETWPVFRKGVFA